MRTAFACAVLPDMRKLRSDWAPTWDAKRLVMDAGFSAEESEALIVPPIIRGEVGIKYVLNGGYVFPREAELRFLVIDFEASRASLSPPPICLDLDLGFEFPFIGTSQEPGDQRPRPDAAVGRGSLPYAVEISLINLYGYLKKLEAIRAPAPRVDKGGRPSKYDWKGAAFELARYVIWKGWPEKTITLVDHLSAWFSAPGGDVPDESQVREFLKKGRVHMEREL